MTLDIAVRRFQTLSEMHNTTSYLHIQEVNSIASAPRHTAHQKRSGEKKSYDVEERCDAIYKTT
jgi:hypothetical protein